jgi:hypothetical protein
MEAEHDIVMVALADQGEGERHAIENHPIPMLPEVPEA